jgi:predicted ArsR family transcriptional regulator
VGKSIDPLYLSQYNGGFKAEAQGYMPEILELEDGREGYLLTEHHCPIWQVARTFQQACSCEREVLFKLLRADVERCDHRMTGHPQCSYLISRR